MFRDRPKLSKQSKLHFMINTTLRWINEGLTLKKREVVMGFLRPQHSIEVIEIDLNNLSDGYLKKNNFSQIWWYKNSIEINPTQRVGRVLKNYVKAGGHFSLSMDAVRFLNL